MHKPSVLIIENAMDITGGVISIERSSVALRDSFDFFFVLPRNSAATSYFQKRNLEVVEFPMKELRKSIFSFLFYIPFLFYNSFKLFRLVKSLEIDIILVNDFYNLLPAFYSFLGGRVPYICYVRFLPSKFPRLLVNFWWATQKQFADSIIAVSETVRKELPFTEKVITIGNELPADRVEYKESNSTLILYPANYIQGKGHESALRCFAAIHKNYPEWKLRFVGSDMGLEKNRQFKRALKQEAIKLGIDDKIEWGSFASNILQEYLNATIVLNFSESESFSLTCLEAMYYGRPVIATRSGGPSEIIDHDETGILVELQDVEGMAKAMEYLITNPEGRDQMARKAYQRVRERFCYDNTIGKLKEVYDSVLLK